MLNVIKSFKSVIWRIAMMIVAFGLAHVAENTDVLQLNTETTIFVGLVLGELSKRLNLYLQK